ncbi:MAG: hypothetical protein IT580_12680 [Verrucomicrobiales bacterium]|nr:hypothetical protein [Verrucomicrobiales bacterium]
MTAWVSYLRGEAEHPLPYDLSRQSMRLTFATMEALRQGGAVMLAEGVSARETPRE